jgi:Rps23 Pro-64 3,4-dihydroxylase Tpa1-like proline 4-hydroxylase
MVMNKEEIAPGIVVYKNVIERYETLIENIEEVVSTKLISWAQASVKADKNIEVETKYRDTQTIVIPYATNPTEDLASPEKAFDSSIRIIFFNSFNSVELDYLKSFEVQTQTHDAYSILKYGIGQKFTNHIDDHKDFPRRVSTVYYLNDNYTGGEINFPRFSISYKPKANEMLIFPSTYVYNHSVSPVIEGTRYAVVSWLT